MNGGIISADTGERDDIVPGPANDVFDPFVAHGFAPGTPWIATIGNHDILINGNFPHGLIAGINDPPQNRADLDSITGPLGLTIPNVPQADWHPGGLPFHQRAAFRAKPGAAFHPAMLPSRQELQALQPMSIPADPKRAPIGVCDFVTEHMNTDGVPVGHGFTLDNEADCTGWYTYEPVPNLPLRVISLSLGPIEGGPSGILARPYDDNGLIAEQVGDPRFDQIAFLEAELARAANDDVAVVIMSHQASDDMVTRSILSSLRILMAEFPALTALLDTYAPVPPEALDTQAFRQLLADSPNVIVHLAGHTHRNTIRAICGDATHRDAGEDRCPAGTDGQRGYWELTTASGVAMPHQGRFFELIQLDDTLLGLVFTSMDARLPADSFAWLGLTISRAADALSGSNRLGQRADRNVVLPINVSAAVAEGMTQSPHRSSQVASTTTLMEAKDPLPTLPVWQQP